MPLLHLLRQNPVIAAVKDNASLQLAIDSECQFISVLYGNICTISNIVKKIKNAGKYAFIHVDLLEGASNKEVVIQFLKLVTEADGIISTKAANAESCTGGGVFSASIACLSLTPSLFIASINRWHNQTRTVLKFCRGACQKCWDG
ncbi:Glycerol-3-phosphate responsive antiterminator [Citrobacter amalonaticus]|nr:Glycerol-3-phosphate responsive antiterminator [Citrobacter amalonaticus]